MKYQKVMIEDNNNLPAKHSFTRKTLQYVCGDLYDVHMFFENDALYPISSSPAYLACVGRLQQAVANQEKVVVYGDYDVDGITATTIAYDMLLGLQLECGYYIPNRMVDGYGLQVNRVEQFHQKGYQLIVCVDNGIVAHDALQRAKELGVDVVIIDHHEPDEQSKAYPYVIHSNLLEAHFSGMCGAGLVFEFSRSFVEKQEYLMLAALGTIADMMVLVEENRRIVRNGLRLMNGVGYLNLQKFSKDRIFDEFTLAMQIAPRLNSIGRLPDLANPNQVVKYFLLQDEVSMDHYMAQVEELNDKRKGMAKDMAMMAETMMSTDAAVMVLSSPEFHEGLVGLVANQLVHKYHKPIMVCQEKDGLCKGSIRSIEGLDLVAMMRGCPHLLKFGGHKMAGGLTFAHLHLEEITNYMNDYVKNLSQVEIEREALVIDLSEITLDGLEELAKYRPLISMQKEPRYYLAPMALPRPMIMSGGLHLKWSLPNGIGLLYFNHPFANLEEDLSDCSFVVKASINEFRGKRSVSLMVEDVCWE